MNIYLVPILLLNIFTVPESLILGETKIASWYDKEQLLYCKNKILKFSSKLYRRFTWVTNWHVIFGGFMMLNLINFKSKFLDIWMVYCQRVLFFKELPKWKGTVTNKLDTRLFLVLYLWCCLMFDYETPTLKGSIQFTK